MCFIILHWKGSRVLATGDTSLAALKWLCSLLWLDLVWSFAYALSHVEIGVVCTFFDSWIFLFLLLFPVSWTLLSSMEVPHLLLYLLKLIRKYRVRTEFRKYRERILYIYCASFKSHPSIAQQCKGSNFRLFQIGGTTLHWNNCTIFFFSLLAFFLLPLFRGVWWITEIKL